VQTEKIYRFRVDKQVGKLVKWLRLLGYDAISDCLPANKYLANASHSDDRIWITNAKLATPIESVIQVHTTNPIEQLRQVIVALHIKQNSLNLFTRCSECNRELIKVDREALRGQVPDYIWETHYLFQTCDMCHKIFWPGSHVDRQRRIIDKLFE